MTCHMCRGVTPCDRCARLAAIGVLVDAVRRPYPEWEYDGLDAIAFLLTERARLVRRHQKEMREESRESQRGARDAYAEGKYDGERSERW